MIKRKRVVITGLGVLAANGIGKEAFWSSLLAGESGIGPVTLFDASELDCQIAGEVKNFDPLDFMDPTMKPRRMGRFSQLGIAAAKMAFEDASIPAKQLEKSGTVPLVMGVATSDIDLVVQPPRIYSTPSLVPHAPATEVAKWMDVPCSLTTLSNACSSGLDAVAHAAELVRTGKSDIAIAGSAEASVTLTTMRSLQKARMLPTHLNDTPKTASCPFSLTRSGGILSEGAAILILESFERAYERGATIYAEVLGFGSHMHPNQVCDGEALRIAMTQAIENSMIHKDQIDYINAHAPSDIHLDKVESDDIKNIFGDRAYDIPVSSIKAVTGNPFGCGGGLQCVATALAIKEGQLIPTSNYASTDPECDLDYVPNLSRQQRIEYALINSRGVGRANSSLILKQI